MRDAVAPVVGAVLVEEAGLVLRELEAGGDREAVVGEEEPCYRRSGCSEVGVEVQQPAGVHERDARFQLVVHHGAGPLGHLVTG
jgi:hypothetical protein